jgi:gas vesicle protein
MRDYDDLPYIVIERRSAGLGAFLWGAAFGAIAGLLLAPRPGTQTQRDIREGVRRARTAAEDGVEAARYTVTRARDLIEDQIQTVRDQIGHVRDRIDGSGDRPGSEGPGRYGAEHRHGARAGDRDPGFDVVITEVSEEPAEGRTDLG